MGRRRSDSVIDNLYELLTVLPVWGGPVLAALAYAGLRWLSPLMSPPEEAKFAADTMIRRIVSQGGFMVAPWVGLGILFLWIAAEVQKRMNRQRLDSQTGRESVRSLSWQEFESLLAEAYRRQGYDVEHTGRDGPDGGVDLRLTRRGEHVLVQCKHWQSKKVGVGVARELMGVVSSEGATGGILVTSGEYTADTQSFAERVPLTLVDGNRLAELIRSVQKNPPAKPDRELTTRQSTICPECGAEMTIRTSRRGSTAGSKFWGCTRYPNCRSTRPVTDI